MENFEEDIRRHNLARQIRIASQFTEFDISKGEVGQEGEVRTWKDGTKVRKVGGKWIPISEGTKSKPQKQQAPKSKKKPLPEKSGKMPDPEKKEISRHEIAKLTTIKSLSKSDPVKAYELAESLSDEAKNVIPQKIWNEMSEASAKHEEDADMKEVVSEKKEIKEEYNEHTENFSKVFDQYTDGTSSLSQDQIDMINEYRSSSRLSSALRRDIDLKRVERELTSLDGIFSKFQLKEDTALFRGIDKRGSQHFKNLVPGDVFVDKGYSSTSIDRSVIDGFDTGDGVSIEILAKKGSQFIPMEGVGDEMINDIFNEEFEFLLPRSSEFRIISNDGKNIKVELL